MKKVICLLLAILMLISIVGCGAKEESAPAPDTKEEAAAPADKKEEAPAASSDEPVTITIGHWMAETGKINGVQAMADAFMADHPNVTIEIFTTDSASYNTMLKTKIAGGDALDITMGIPQNFVELIEGGYIADITGSDFLADIPAGFLDQCSVNGKVYGLPLDAMILGVFYNKDVFAEAGVEVPTTEAEFFDVIEKVEAAGLDAFSAYFSHPKMPWIDLTTSERRTLINSGNADIWQKIASGEKTFADYSDVLTEVYTDFASRVAHYGTDSTVDDWTGYVSAIANGTSAMQIDGSWMIGEYYGANPDANIGFFPVPSADGENDNTMGIGVDDCFMVLENSPNKEIAMEFLAYMASPEAIRTWSKTANQIPVNTTVELEVSNDCFDDILAYMADGHTYADSEIKEFTGEMQTKYWAAAQTLALDALENGTDVDIAAFIEQLDAEIGSLAG